jgi:hypothetical protein
MGKKGKRGAGAAADKGKRKIVITYNYKGADFYFQLAKVKNEVVLLAFGQHLHLLPKGVGLEPAGAGRRGGRA